MRQIRERGFGGAFGLFVLGSAMTLAVACGSSERAGYDDGSSPNGMDGTSGGPPLVADDTLVLEPPNAEISLEDGKPIPTVEYHAYLAHKDGSRVDVTPNAVFRMVQNAGPVQGTFMGATFTPAANAVGKATVHA